MQRIEVGLLTLMVFLVGCPSGEEDSWTQIELISDVVWSDDQQAIAYTLERYKSRKLRGPLPTSTFRPATIDIPSGSPTQMAQRLRSDSRSSRPVH